MHARAVVLEHTYRDSVEMMRLAGDLEAVSGILRAAVLMATPMNRDLLAQADLLVAPADAAGADDLVVAVLAVDEPSAEMGLARARELLTHSFTSQPSIAEFAYRAPHSIGEAATLLPGANLALISVPGRYAAAEALKALKRGLHVFLFSDNVSLADEVRLKQTASERGLLLMGPDCGTAIVDGVPLGFANAVRQGRIGLVSASGTGLQQVSCLIDRLGSGISQAIGVGGRDLSAEVGGLMMRRGIDALGADPATHVVVLISKPASQAVLAAVVEQAAKLTKPVVACIIGADVVQLNAAGLVGTATLEEAAVRAVALDQRAEWRDLLGSLDPSPCEDDDHVSAGRFAPSQRYVRGLFAGGTFCSEARHVLAERLGAVTALEGGEPADASGHAVVDLGADAFTVGRPHPMIDGRLRAEWLRASANDPTVAVILLDVVLGYGADPNPVGTLAPAVQAARTAAANDGRHLAFVASVCGTQADSQQLDGQEAQLRKLDIVVAWSNAAAARRAVHLVESATKHGSGARP